MQGGCEGDLARSRDELVQVECKLDGNDVSLVLLLEPAQSKVTAANLDGNPTGQLSKGDYVYEMSFPARPGLYASYAVLNRYDGRMERELGQAPFSIDHGLTIRKGNVFQIWQCTRAGAEPRF